MDKLNDTLKHHGVLGMKWGVRKDRNSSTPKKNISVQIGKHNRRKATFMDRVGGIPVRLDVAIAATIVNAVQGARAKRKVLKTLSQPASNFRKKDLKLAASIVRRNSDVKFKVDGKEYEVPNRARDRQRKKEEMQKALYHLLNDPI